MDTEIFIRAQGTTLIRGAGTPVTLRGVGLGGWMNMENFITGFPGTESQQRRALRSALGEEGYRRFFDRFLRVFFDEADARFLASVGINLVRVPFNYRHFEDDDRPFELKEEGFRWLDRVVELCARSGIYTILDLHAAPGCQNQHWHSDNATHWSQFWTHKHFQDRVVHLWEALAGRYRGNAWVAGYNVLNEPGDVKGEKIGPFYQRVHDAIRAVDPDHVIFFDGNRYGLDFGMFGEPLPNCVYSAHDYAMSGFVDAGPYPGTSRGQFFDRAKLEEFFLARTEYMRRTGTPIWIGEFGPVYSGDAGRDAGRYQVLRDQLDIYRKHGASWSIWTYKDIGLQGLVHLPTTSPYVKRIEPVLARKARLGVDAWGTVDAGIRHLLEPIERTFKEEFPAFKPFPFGAQSWMEVLVRHILLAEPMVDDFRRCFEGLSPEQAEALADCFRFDRCVVREELTQMLAAEATLSRP
jgi:aryl-phospho-beta-D-glucosidase BglC (GH1 family)